MTASGARRAPRRRRAALVRYPRSRPEAPGEDPGRYPGPHPLDGRLRDTPRWRARHATACTARPAWSAPCSASWSSDPGSPGPAGHERGQFDPRGQAELGQDVGDVELDGAAGDEHPGGDVGVGSALGQERGYRLLGVGEGRQDRTVLVPKETVADRSPPAGPVVRAAGGPPGPRSAMAPRRSTPAVSAAMAITTRPESRAGGVPRSARPGRWPPRGWWRGRRSRAGHRVVQPARAAVEIDDAHHPWLAS